MSVPSTAIIREGQARTTDGAAYVTVGAGSSLDSLTLSNPTFTGNVKGAPSVLYESGIPFIGLSSGSVSAVGAITGITALPIVYASAYCWFPANILATVKVAGWYYCTFSSTTAGTAFLNTYTAGVPTIPASPTAVTDGKGAFTGETAEIFGPTINVPVLGANDAILFSFMTRFTNSVNNKTTNLRFSGNAGTVITTSTLTSQLGEYWTGEIWNRGATNVQTSTAIHVDNAQVLRTAASVAAAIDTTAATTLVLSSIRATATDNFVIEAASIARRAN